MRTAAVVRYVEEAKRYATLETMEVGSVNGNSTRAVRMKDGSLVTEANVSDFIRERLDNHHHTWIRGNLEQALHELYKEVSHEFLPLDDPPLQTCKTCGLGVGHKVHK